MTGEFGVLRVGIRMDGDREYARPADVFVGRLQELAALAAALGVARSGKPQVVLIQGEAGVGKSSLISGFLDARQGMPVITASGEEAEALLPYGVVQQLAGRGVAVSADALSGLELLSQGTRANADPLLVGVELLALFSCLQGSEAIVVVIEDLQWIDLASARALLFACRRLSADRVLVILTCRPGGMSQLGEGWERFVSGDRRATRLTLSGLDVHELGMLCRALGRTGLSERTFRRLRQYTGGNPLLVRALLAELTDEALNDARGSLRAPRSLAEVIQLRLAGLSQAARDLVAAASVLGEHSRLVDVAAVAGAAVPAAALGEAERGGILLEEETPSGWRVWFPHLLVRQAVYGGLGAEQRRALHLRAAAIVGGEERLAHRTAAAAGADRDLAADLDEAAEKAAAAGKLRRAARYRQQAAAVTSCGLERDERMLSSFELLVRAADVNQAEAARPAVEGLPVSARRDAALGQLALLAARPLEARVLLGGAWEAHDPAADAAAGTEAALGLGMLFGISGPFTESTMWLDRALGGATGSEPWYDAARGMRAVPFTLSGDSDKALSLFRDLPERAAMVPIAKTDAVAYRGLVKLWTGDLHGAIDDLGVAANRIRSGLQVRFPGQPLAFLAEAEFRRGRWDDCQDHAELAVSLACDADLYYDLPIVHSAAARVPACRGDWAVAASHVEAAEDAARTFGGFAEIFAASARSILGFARDDPGEALLGAAMALAVPEIDFYDDPAAFWWRPLQIWALVRIGQLGEAEAVLAAFESLAADRGESLALINAAWLRGLLAMARGELERAEKVLGEGCHASDSGPFRFHRGLLNLEHGRCLSRLQRRKAAIAAVRAADDVFTALAARPFMDATASELTALGVRPHGGDPDLPGLTAQELRVARLVASGLSNREVAARLYLSPKTVEYHLAGVFTKLGVSHRHQLAARIRGREAPRHQAQGETQGNP
jgi:DNA-binding CsgD family transcriptional regulator/tetratricopeptide (TPR) repeat protein